MNKIPAFLLCASLHLAALAAPPVTLEKEIADLSERVYLAPREGLTALKQLQTTRGPLSVQDQALLYEQFSHAKMLTGDIAGALQYARQLEQLGKQNKDESIECLGLLYQSYAEWRLGEIQSAYQLSRRAAQFPAERVSKTARIKALLSLAQLESEEDKDKEALQWADEAVQASLLSQDKGLMFMAYRMQAILALAANDTALALKAVDQAVALAADSPYPERLIRAKATEFSVATAAGLTTRANEAMTARIALIRQLGLDEVLGRTIVDYAELKLKSNQFADAASLSAEALELNSVKTDNRLASKSHFNHALATIHLGQLAEGKAEVEKLFKAGLTRAQQLAYLAEYIAALTQAGDVDGSVQASALRQKLEAEEALQRAKEDDKARDKLDQIVRDKELKELEARARLSQRNLWLTVAGSAVLGLLALLFFYVRLKQGKRKLEEANLQLFNSSNRDALTGLYNRRYVHSQLITPARRSGDSAGLLLLMDIDFFKRLNDSHGHAVGDLVLQETAKRLGALFRSDDIVARWGGEEFLAILPNSAVADGPEIAARLLAQVSATPVTANGKEITVTISVGICPLHIRLQDREMGWEEAVHLADQALYMAKEKGRNRAYAVTGVRGLSSSELGLEIADLAAVGRVTLSAIPGLQAAA